MFLVCQIPWIMFASAVLLLFALRVPSSSGAAANQESPFPYDLLRHLLAKDNDECFRRSACVLARNYNNNTEGLFGAPADLSSWSLPLKLTSVIPDERGSFAIKCGPGTLHFHADGPWTRLIQVQFQRSRRRRWVDYFYHARQKIIQQDEVQRNEQRGSSEANATKRRVPAKPRKTRQSGLGLPHISNAPDTAPNVESSPMDLFPSNTPDEEEEERSDKDQFLENSLEVAPAKNDQQLELEPSSALRRPSMKDDQELEKKTSFSPSKSLVLPAYEGTLERPQPNSGLKLMRHGNPEDEERLRDTEHWSGFNSRYRRQASGDFPVQGAFIITARPSIPMGQGASGGSRPSTFDLQPHTPEDVLFMGEGREVDMFAKPTSEVQLSGLAGFRHAYHLGVQGVQVCRRSFPKCRQRDGVLLRFAAELFF